MSGKPFDLIFEAARPDDGPNYIALIGYLDAHTVRELEEASRRTLDSGNAKLILDLQQLQYISSAGIGAIMALLQQLRRRRGDMIVLQPRPKVHEMLELLGFTDIFQIVPDRAAAMALLLPSRTS